MSQCKKTYCETQNWKLPNCLNPIMTNYKETYVVLGLSIESGFLIKSIDWRLTTNPKTGKITLKFSMPTELSDTLKTLIKLKNWLKSFRTTRCKTTKFEYDIFPGTQFYMTRTHFRLTYSIDSIPGTIEYIMFPWSTCGNLDETKKILSGHISAGPYCTHMHDCLQEHYFMTQKFVEKPLGAYIPMADLELTDFAVTEVVSISISPLKSVTFNDNVTVIFIDNVGVCNDTNSVDNSSIEEPLPAIEEPLLAIEEPLPAIEEPLPAIEEPLPAIEEPLPAIEEPLPAIEEPLPVIEDPRHDASIEASVCSDPLGPLLHNENFLASLDEQQKKVENLLVTCSQIVLSTEVLDILFPVRVKSPSPYPSISMSILPNNQDDRSYTIVEKILTGKDLLYVFIYMILCMNITLYCSIA
jgi:hypothetical protein